MNAHVSVTVENISGQLEKLQKGMLESNKPLQLETFSYKNKLTCAVSMLHIGKLLVTSTCKNVTSFIWHRIIFI